MCYNEDMEENSTRTTWLTKYELIDLEARHAALVKKAAKLGVPAPTYHLTGEERERLIDEVWRTTVTEYELAYETFPIRYAGWKFVAVVDHRVGIVTAAPAAPEGVVAEYIGTDPTCDACGHGRHRTYTVVVENEEGERLRVGGTCVKNYIGDLGIKPWLSFEDEIREAYEGSGSPAHANIFPTEVIVAIAHRVIESEGRYVNATNEFKVPTKSLVRTALYPSVEDSREVRKWRHEIVDITKADCEYAAKAIEYAKGLAGDNDFELNLKGVVSDINFDCSGRGFGILVYVAEAYRRAEAKRVEAEAEAKVGDSKSPAPVGRCIVRGTVAGLYVKNNPYSHYGTITKVRVIADEGYGVYLTLPSAIDHANKGDRVEFTATLEPSHDDRFFAFGSRPSKARILEPAA